MSVQDTTAYRLGYCNVIHHLKGNFMLVNIFIGTRGKKARDKKI